MYVCTVNKFDSVYVCLDFRYQLQVLLRLEGHRLAHDDKDNAVLAGEVHFWVNFLAHPIITKAV